MTFRSPRGFFRSSPSTRASLARRSLRVWWCIAALWTWGACAAAQTGRHDSSPTLTLPTVTVTASSLVDDQGFGRWDFSGSMTERPFSVAERLDETPGIHLVRRGEGLPDNQDDAVVVRGFDARRYVLALNEHPVGMSGVMGGSRVDWDLLPPFADDSLCFDRSGRTSAPHGALGGTVRMATTSPTRRTARLQWEGGPFETERRVFEFGDRQGAFGYRLFAGLSHSEGFLRNQERDQDKLAGRLFYEDPRGQDNLEVGWSQILDERGYAVANRPGAAGYDPAFPDSDGERINPGDFVASPGSKLDRDLSFLDLTWRRAVADGQWSTGYSRTREERSDLIRNRVGTVFIDRSIESDRSDYLFLQREGRHGASRWKAGVDHRSLRYGDGSYRTAPANAMKLFASQKVDLAGLFGEWRKKMHCGELEFSFRQQSFEGAGDDDRSQVMRDLEEQAFIPQVAWSWETSDGWRNRLSWRRLWRAPSMAEYYWWSANFTNPARIGSGRTLSPEDGHGVGWDIEKSFGPHRVFLASLYRNELRDYIHFVHAFPFSCYNIDHVRIQGTEWSWRQQVARGTDLQVGHTWQETERRGVAAADLRNGLANELDYRPRHIWNWRLTHQSRWWDFAHTLRHVGAQRASMNPTPFKQETVRLDPFTVQDLEARLRWTDTTTLTFRIENLTDQEYNEQAGFPMPGRTFWFKAERRF